MFQTATSGVGKIPTKTSNKNWEKQVAQVFKQKGVPAWVWIPIMASESSGNPNVVAYTPTQSVGLFQLDTVSGQGKGYSKSYLQNPVHNAEIASGPIAQAYHDALLHYAKYKRPEMPMGATQFQILTYVAQHSGHAGLVSPYSHDLANTFNALRNGTKYNGFGLSKSLAGQFGSATIYPFSGANGGPIKQGENALKNLNPATSIENYVSKNWVTWVLVIGLVFVIAILIYKGVAS
jgi:hypothetical protein